MGRNSCLSLSRSLRWHLRRALALWACCGLRRLLLARLCGGSCCCCCRPLLLLLFDLVDQLLTLLLMPLLCKVLCSRQHKLLAKLALLRLELRQVVMHFQAVWCCLLLVRLCAQRCFYLFDPSYNWLSKLLYTLHDHLNVGPVLPGT